VIELKKILEKLEPLSVKGAVDHYIRDIQYDSRKVGEEEAFVAIKGFRTDGHQFIEQAYQNGARVFFVEKPVDIGDATIIQLQDTRLALARIARVFFGYPDRRLKIVGITGTNGKTTTAYLLSSILKEAHWCPGLISTIAYYDGKTFIPAERTTPESLDIYRLLYRMKNSGLKSVVMEVSSHALSLHRVEEIEFNVGVFTNLGRDHLDFHQTMEQYFLAKRQLFEGMTENQKAVLNLDDPYTSRIIDVTEAEVFTYSKNLAESTVGYVSHQVRPDGMVLMLRIPSGNLMLESNLIGEFNIYNIMAAVTTARALGVHDEFIARGVRNLKRIPGRCEYYPSPEGFGVYLDYAHTPDGLRNVLRAVWETHPKNLIVVFGAGGDRDKGKRPEMGRVAEDFADKIILTNDNPRSEDPDMIIEQIVAGVTEKDKVTKISGREEAIRFALNMAKKGDAVLIAGKGHERYQEIQGKRIPFDDHEVVANYFKEKGWPIPSFFNSKEVL